VPIEGEQVIFDSLCETPALLISRLVEAFMPAGRKMARRMASLRRFSEPPATLPFPLKSLEPETTVVVWFDSGRAAKPGERPRYTISWAFQPVGGARLPPEGFLSKIIGTTGFLSGSFDPMFYGPNHSEVRAFMPRLPDPVNLERAPTYVFDLVGAWYGLAVLRTIGYTRRVDMVTDGKNAVDVMRGASSPRFTYAERNLGKELRDSLRTLSLGGGSWHFVPEEYTRFLDRRQSHDKLVVRQIMNRSRG
jgi:hypothetical protein